MESEFVGNANGRVRLRFGGERKRPPNGAYQNLFDQTVKPLLESGLGWAEIANELNSLGVRKIKADTPWKRWEIRYLVSYYLRPKFEAD